jgi:hypothetical protein
VCKYVWHKGLDGMGACLGAHGSSGAMGKKVISMFASELSPENSRARIPSSVLVPNMAEICVVLDTWRRTCCFSVNSGAGCYDVVNSLKAVFFNGSGWVM